MRKIASLSLLYLFVFYFSLSLGVVAETLNPTYDANKRLLHKIISSRTSRLIAYGWDAYNEKKYNDAELIFKRILEIEPDNKKALYGLSWTYFKIGRHEEALQGFQELFNKGYKKKECGEALFYLYLNKGQKQEAKKFLAYLSEEKQAQFKRFLAKKQEKPKRKRSSPPKKKAKAKTKIKARAKKRVKAQPHAKPTNDLNEYFKLAQARQWKEAINRFNKLSPSLQKRKDVLLVAGWAFFNVGDEKKAKVLFESLLEKEPSKEEVAYGLALSCLRLGDKACISSLAQRFSNSQRITQLFCNDLKEQMAYDYEKGRYKAVIHGYRRFSSFMCQDDNDKLKEFTAWAALKEGDYQLAERLFSSLSQKEEVNSSIYQGLISSYEHLGKEDKAWDLAERLSKSTKTQEQRPAADFFFSKGLASRAAYIWDSEDEPYYNADTLSVEGGYSYTYLDGDKGTSRLRIQEMPLLNLKIQPSQKIRMTLGLSHLLLQSGPAGEHPWLGTPALFNQKSSAKTSIDCYVPYVAFDYQSRWRVTGSLSTTPIGGPVDPVPLFDFSIHKTGHTDGISLFQRGVTRSILSWTGQRDPYTGKEWGRVVETGISAITSFDLKRGWWLSLEGGYGHLWGKNTWHNTRLSAGISAGHSLKNQYFSDASYGLFTTITHFDRNTNFYTFGHGGYFSPQFFLASGPFVHLKTIEGKRWLVDTSASLSYLNFYEKESAFYPTLSSLKGRYSSDQSSKLGFSIKLSSGYLFSPYLMGKLRFNIDRSGDYTQYHVGVLFSFFFEPRKGVLYMDLPDSSSFLYH